MRFGKIKKFIIFGGHQRLVNFIRAAKDFSCVVVSAPRLLDLKLEVGGRTLRECLVQEKIQFFDIENIKDWPAQDHVDAHTMGVSIGAPWIFDRTFLAHFNGRLVNGHGVNLPRNRGGGFYSWQIMNGEREGRVLFHQIDDGIDSGAVVCSSSFDYPSACRKPADYIRFYITKEIAFFDDFLSKIKNDFDFKLETQAEEKSTYFPRLSLKYHSFINWEWSAIDIERFILAFSEPYQGACTFLTGRRVFIRDAKVYALDGQFHPFLSGMVYRVHHGIFIAARDSALCVTDIADEAGGDMMPQVKVGQRFVTPRTYIEDALCSTAIYGAKGLTIVNPYKE